MTAEEKRDSGLRPGGRRSDVLDVVAPNNNKNATHAASADHTQPQIIPRLPLLVCALSLSLSALPFASLPTQKSSTVRAFVPRWCGSPTRGPVVLPLLFCFAGSIALADCAIASECFACFASYQSAMRSSTGRPSVRIFAALDVTCGWNVELSSSFSRSCCCRSMPCRSSFACCSLLCW